MKEVGVYNLHLHISFDEREELRLGFSEVEMQTYLTKMGIYFVWALRTSFLAYSSYFYGCHNHIRNLKLLSHFFLPPSPFLFYHFRYFLFLKKYIKKNI